MNKTPYVVVFPNDFSKNKITQLISNIKKILKIKNQEFSSIKRDNGIILVDANDPVFASSAINLLFGVEKTAIARQIKNNFEEIVDEITSLGGNLLLNGEKFLVKVDGVSKGFFTKDVELSATSAIIEKKSKISAKPGTENDYDKILYTFLTKNNAYVCIYLDTGLGGIPLQPENQDTICSIYDEISAISCYETIKQGFNPKIIVCYKKKSELLNLVRIINQIVPRLIRRKIDVDFYFLNYGSGIKNHLMFVNSVLDILIKQASEKKINYVSLALSPIIFPKEMIDASIKQVFENNLLPILPMTGIDSNIFDDAKEMGLTKSFTKIRKMISINSQQIPKKSRKASDVEVKSKKTVSVNIGPNNVHDILDSLNAKH